jgi:hypothetical protein
VKSVWLLMLLALAPTASAQDLRPGEAKLLDLSTVAFAGSAAADWITTYRFNTHGGHEDNPFIGWMQQRSPAGMVALGAAIDAGGVWAWRRAVGRDHPVLAAAGLSVASAFRVYLAVRNERRMRQVPWPGTRE